MSRISDHIIRSRGELPQRDKIAASDANDEERYSAYTLDSFPRMGFSVFCRNGDRHSFYFHNIDNSSLRDVSDYQLMSLSHRGKVVSLRGRDLHGIIEGLEAHTLQAIYEYDEAYWPAVEEGGRIVDRIAVTELAPPGKKSAEDK